jgi:endonuclease III
VILPVDARVSRVARRLGFGEASDDFRKQARSIQAALTGELPRSADAFRHAYLYLSHHGAATCTETDPHCVICPVLGRCPEGRARTRHGGGAAG